MINDLIHYSAATAKARAMYGKMLTETEWTELTAADGLRSVWELLRKSGAWALVGEDPRCAGDGALLTEALTRQLERDVKNLCLYLGKKDRELLRFFLRRPDGSMTPEETRAWWEKGGAKNAGLRRIAGAEADALNIVYILRLRQFPASLDRAGELLIDVRDKLTPDLVQRLLRARNDREILELLSKTPWRDMFTTLAPGQLEAQYSAYMAAFCRRLLAGARPGLPAAQAFLTLKEMERQRLVRLVGAAARGIDPNLVV